MAYYKNPKYQYSLNQGGPLYMKFKEAAGQSWKAGQPVYLADGISLTARGDGHTYPWLGLACADATGVTGTYAQVLVLRGGDVLEMDVYAGGATDAATETMLFQNFACNLTSNETTLDLNTTNDDFGVLIKICNDDATKVHVLPLLANLQYHVGY
jgi:hypothetical protein